MLRQIHYVRHSHWSAVSRHHSMRVQISSHVTISVTGTSTTVVYVGQFRPLRLGSAVTGFRSSGCTFPGGRCGRGNMRYFRASVGLGWLPTPGTVCETFHRCQCTFVGLPLSLASRGTFHVYTRAIVYVLRKYTCIFIERGFWCGMGEKGEYQAVACA